VTCPEERVIAFLSGELPPDEERRFDEHLLSCEQCWQAVKADQAARLALEKLRQPAPAGLQERVALAIALASQDEAKIAAGQRRPLAPRWRRWATAPPRNPRLVAAACLVVVMAAGATAWVVATRPAPSDPAQVAAVVAMMTPGSPPTTALRAGEHFVIAGQPLTVRAYQLEGTEQLVATSARPFPMPSTSHLLPGSSSQAWMATKGRLSMYGVNRRGGGQSMFVVADMPMAEMPQLAARLDLI
jgi:anti-sigma factor RsiW